MRPLITVLLLSHASVAAQTPMRYSFVTRSLSTIDSLDFVNGLAELRAKGTDVSRYEKMGREVALVRTSAITVVARDSAGGSVWEITRDTAVVTDSPVRALLRSRFSTQQPDAGARTVYHIYIRAGSVKTMSCVEFPRLGLPTPCASWGTRSVIPGKTALYEKMPGLAFLIPVADLPAKIGETFRSGSITHRDGQMREIDAITPVRNPPTSPVARLPGTADTVQSVWTRKSADTFEGTTRRRDSKMIGNQIVITADSGVHQIKYDESRMLKEMHSQVWTVSTYSRTRVAKTGVMARSTVYSLVRTR